MCRIPNANATAGCAAEHRALHRGFAIDPANVGRRCGAPSNFGLSAALYGKVRIDNGRMVPKTSTTIKSSARTMRPKSPSKSTIPALHSAGSAKSGRLVLRRRLAMLSPGLSVVR
jgi:hypothetical protein